MSVQIPMPTVQRFTEINIGKYKTTKHYEVTADTSAVDTQKINIVKDRHFARSLPDYWLSYRVNNRWRRVTGLFNVNGSKYFKGDKGHNNVKEHLIIVCFNDVARMVTIYTFKNYYSKNPASAIQLIQNNNL